MVTDREYQPIAEVPLEDRCIVCTHAVLDDPKQQRGDHTSPVRMPDGYWTHAGCEDDYWDAAEELLADDGGNPADLDYLATATSAHAEYEERQRSA